MRSAETVACIIEAAARILEERGFAGYTTNAVAEKAGVGVGSLYQYFPGKDALTAALIERETAVLLDDVAEAERAASGAQGLKQLIRAAVAHQMRRPALARLLDFEEQRLPLELEVGRVSFRLEQAIVRLLARMAQESPADPQQAAADMLAICKGMVDAAGQRGETDAASLEGRVARAIFGYLEPLRPGRDAALEA
ncbi:TetR/AcrR family transcriptional regulator [Methylocella silvestris]|uniref:TetR/AcrR family transcriptional regulator n=1 Tax=Methylocella silvestris TaxID=199596 RepID=UPI001FE061C4|nr:TetR/AcrR family transcriptional regulator [Methylocella silvestris]